MRPGLHANLLLVDRNPLQDIAATECVALGIYEREGISRGSSFEESTHWQWGRRFGAAAWPSPGVSWRSINSGFQRKPFNPDGKNRYGMEHICHHEPNSVLIVWLLIALDIVVGGLYRLRYLHLGDHSIRSAEE